MTDQKTQLASGASLLSVKLAADKETVRYAEYILNHYDRNSHADHLVLARNLEAWADKRNQVANISHQRLEEQ